jgi:hypothetical protein
MTYDKSELNKLINEDNLSYEVIGRMFGVSGSAIKKAALRLGLILPRKRKINPNETFNKGIVRNEVKRCVECSTEYVQYSQKRSECCSTTCFNIHQHKLRYQSFLDGGPSVMRVNYNLAKFKPDILSEQDNKCAICNCKPYHNGQSLVFILDHIDGDAANNKRDNLRLVCPNCDSQLPTYKSKNKISSRTYRYNKSE